VLTALSGISAGVPAPPHRERLGLERGPRAGAGPRSLRDVSGSAEGYDGLRLRFRIAGVVERTVLARFEQRLWLVAPADAACPAP
jgi:hypothetical protein